MVETKHTPGPWVAHTFMVKSETTRDTITQTGYSSSFAGNPSRSYEAEANARLIAAAPDMLAALQAAMTAWAAAKAGDIAAVNWMNGAEATMLAAISKATS